MDNRYLNAALAENFFTSMARVCDYERDNIDSLMINAESTNHEALYAIYIKNLDSFISIEQLPLLRQFVMAVCSDKSLHCEPDEDLIELLQQENPQQYALDFGDS